jgi:dihydrofolate reductase
MARLIYSALTSLDGYVADEKGNFDWAAPREDVHRFVNDLTRPIGTHLYGRRMYDILVAWESDDIWIDESPVTADFARIWRAADKIVFSRSLDAPTSARTTIERDFSPDAVRRLKAEAERDLSIGGPELAGQAIRAGLVDEIQLFLNPIVVGRGNAALPDDMRVELELIEERRFDGGVVFVRYGVTGTATR